MILLYSLLVSLLILLLTAWWMEDAHSLLLQVDIRSFCYLSVRIILSFIILISLLCKNEAFWPEHLPLSQSLWIILTFWPLWVSSFFVSFCRDNNNKQVGSSRLEFLLFDCLTYWVVLDSSCRGTKFLDLKSVVDDAISECDAKNHPIKNCIVVKNSHSESPPSKKHKGETQVNINMVSPPSLFWGDLILEICGFLRGPLISQKKVRGPPCSGGT